MLKKIKNYSIYLRLRVFIFLKLINLGVHDKKIEEQQTYILYGKEEGREEGLETGYARGIDDGAKREKISIISNMYAKGIPLHQIADYLDMPIEEVEDMFTSKPNDYEIKNENKIMN